jgi:transposase
MSSRSTQAQQLFYSEEFKQKIVEEVLSGKLNKNQATKLYGIRGNATVLYWIRQSHGFDPSRPVPKNVSNFAEMRANMINKKLGEENKELRELLRVAELRADVWQKAVEIAEETFDIEIVKKFGAQALQQLKKQDQKQK